MSIFSSVALHRIKKFVKNSPNLLAGYNIYVDTDKLRLIDHVFTHIVPKAHSFADLGGVWNVNAGYTIYTLRTYDIQRGVLVDTNFPDGLSEQLSAYPALSILHGDFANTETIAKIGTVDVLYFFDVLLHQANPSWIEVLTAYEKNVSCIVIYNQQYVRGETTIRLTDLPLEKYLDIAPKGRDDIYRYVYAHSGEIHPLYKKPWKDIHNIFQWGITDKDLRATMNEFGFQEVYFKNHGQFSNLPSFENHAFIFVRR